MPQINPNIQVASSPDEIQRRKAYDEANNVVGRGSFWQAL